MNVTVAIEALLPELELLVKIVASKPTIPILANCLVQANGDKLRLAATDLIVSLLTSCEARVTEPGTVTLPVKHLLDIVKLLSQDITLVTDQSSVRLVSGTYQSRLQTHPATDYPSVPSMQGLSPLPLTTDLSRMIAQVRFAVPDTKKKYYLSGALLTSTSLVATDGHRLAMATCTAQNGLQPMVIPSHTLDTLDTMMPATDMVCASTDQHLFFVIDGRLLVSRRAEGQFPQYERVIPRETNSRLSVSRPDLLTALERVVLIAPNVLFQVTPEPDVLTLTSRSHLMGEAVEQLPATYTGPTMTVTLVGPALLEFIRAATGAMITAAWKDQGPVMFSDQANYLYVQMPMRS